MTKPLKPSSTISPGPLGQSKVIIGSPQDSASVMTRPKPSSRELKTKIELLAYSFTILAVRPFKKIDFARPKVSISFCNSSLFEPSPNIVNVQSGYFVASCYQLLIRISNPLANSRRPTAITFLFLQLDFI